MERHLHIVVSEVASLHLHYPFSILHPAWETLQGCGSLFDILRREFPGASCELEGRAKIIDSFEARKSFVSESASHALHLRMAANAIILPGFGDFIAAMTADALPVQLVSSDGVWLGEYGYRDALTQQIVSGAEPPTQVIVPRHLGLCAESLYDYLDVVGRSIDSWARFSGLPVRVAESSDCWHLVGSGGLFAHESVSIGPGAVLDTTKGAIVLESGVEVMPLSYIAGPCYIGTNTTIKALSKVYSQCAIGPHCKVGGEIENTIIQGYANKQHDGFVGHSFISEWVNLGADTNTSDLKNTYGSISLRYPSGERGTNRMFLGVLCGDHSKSAINTAFSTGTLVGIHANVFGSGFPQRTISSYTWGGYERSTLYQFDKAVEVARLVMSRRQRHLHEAEVALMEEEYLRSRA